LPFFAFLGGFAMMDARRPAISDPDDDRITTDEAALLDALSAAQAGDQATVAATLGGWMAPVVRCLAIDSLRQLSSLLGRAGIRLARRRPVRLVALAAE
jgi:hypothetical protein